MPVRVVALALIVVGCAGSTTAGQDTVRGAKQDAAPVEESLLPAVAGVELRIAVRPDVWSLATTPRVEIEVVNHSGRDIVMMPPQDGSWWGMRDPDYHLEFLDERGAIVPAAVGQQAGCGRLEGYRAERLVTIAPGGRVSLHGAPEAHPYPFSPNVSAHPGRHRVRLRYRADVPGGTPMELVSNTVDVTIAGGDLALWSCYNGPKRVPPPYDWMSHAPHQALPFADGFVVLDRRERVHGAQGRWRRWGAWWLYRVDGDGELRGDPLPLRGAVGHGDVQLSAIDDAVWLVAGAGQVLEAMQVGSQGGTLTLGAPVVWARDVLDPHRFAVTPGGALYFGREGPGDLPRTREVVLQRLAGGAPVGAPTRVGTAREARELALTGDPRGGSWAAWSVHADPSVVMVRRVGPDGAPVGPELSVPGELLALRGQAVGFTLASSGEPDGPCIVARTHDDLGRSGPAVALVPGDDCGLGTDPTWRPDNADIAWGPGPTAAVFVGQALTGDPFVRFARAGGPVRTLSTTATRATALAARGDEWLAVWSDERSARATGCVAEDGCVAELWLAIEGPHGQRVPPKRLTRDARPGRPEFDRSFIGECDELRRQLEAPDPGRDAGR